MESLYLFPYLNIYLTDTDSRGQHYISICPKDNSIACFRTMHIINLKPHFFTHNILDECYIWKYLRVKCETIVFLNVATKQLIVK